MRIGIFSTEFPYKCPFDDSYNRNIKYFWGGVAEVTFQLALALNKRGHEIKIFTTSIDNKEEVQRYENITLYRYPKTFRLKQTDISLGLFFKPLRHDVDIVHIQRGSPPGAIAGYFYSKINRKSFVLSYHDDPESINGGIIKKVAITIFGLILNGMLEDAKIISSLSSEFMNKSKFLKKYKNKIKIIPNGINLDEYDIFESINKAKYREYLSLPKDKKLILYVGTLTQKKSPDTLLKAMIGVIKMVPNSNLIFVGDGIMRAKLEDMSTKLELDNVVIFKGFVKEEEKRMLYKSADIFVQPSLSEGFPMVLLESCASGLPVIVSDLEAFKIVVKDGYNGYFTRKGDEKDLTEKITYLLKNDDKRIIMGENARNMVKNFCWDTIANDTCTIYETILSGSSSTK